MLALALAGAFVWSLHYKLNEYAITPGVAQPVGPLIKVADHPHASTRKTIYLTDVYLTQLTIWQWLAAEIHPVHEQLVPGGDLTGGVPDSELEAQGYLEMYDSQNDAKAAAMRSLGLPVSGTPGGATIEAIAGGAPAAAALSVGDRIVAARGRPVTTLCSLASALSGATPGTPITLHVERADTSKGYLTYAPPSAVSVTPGPVATVARLRGCPGSPTQTAELGIFLEQATAWKFPFKVSINTTDIGGPSAGLAMTLGIIDALSKVSITGTLRIAATGTIDPHGNVGDVGGVAEKTIAVEQAGATVFLVPVPELAVARKAASGGLKVVAVSTLDQAMAAIERLGGTRPVPIETRPR